MTAVVVRKLRERYPSGNRFVLMTEVPFGTGAPPYAPVRTVDDLEVGERITVRREAVVNEAAADATMASIVRAAWKAGLEAGRNGGRNGG